VFCQSVTEGVLDVLWQLRGTRGGGDEKASRALFMLIVQRQHRRGHTQAAAAGECFERGSQYWNPCCPRIGVGSSIVQECEDR
jgi:hypothetical protein